MQTVNIATVILGITFLYPLITGLFTRISRERIDNAVFSLLSYAELAAALIFSIFLTRKIFFEHSNVVFAQIYGFIPEAMQKLLNGKDLLTYLVSVPVLLAINMLLIKLLMLPVYRRVIEPLGEQLYQVMRSMQPAARAAISAMARLPKAVFFVLAVSFLLNFSTYYASPARLIQDMNTSFPYQFLYRYVIYPAMDSNFTKGLPVLLRDTFGPGEARIIPSYDESTNIPRQIADRISGSNPIVVEYFNGITLDEAVRSTPEIDAAAVDITSGENSTREKAFRLYQWITKNVQYDYTKAERITESTEGLQSGAVVAFETHKGICFDYSSLYVAMCRAAGIKVRLVTGLGYSGRSWGDHAWNQVFLPEERRWVNVDTTFGTAANYFDKRDFATDHLYDDVQGEW